MTTLPLLAAGTSLSTGLGTAHVIWALEAAGSATSTGYAYASLVTPSLQVTTLGAVADAEQAAPLRVTQVGTNVDALRTPHTRITQLGTNVDALRTPHTRVTQVGATVDAQKRATLQTTIVGVLVDAKYNRPQMTDNCWEFHVYDRVGHWLAYLDGAYEQAYFAQLNDVGGGAFKLHSTDAKATDENLTIGNVVRVRYRNVDIGAFLIEQVDEELVSSDEGAGQVISVSGRGLLALLEKGLVYPADLNDPSTTTREFTAQTRADIFLTLYNEFQTRSGGDLTTSFTAANDSDGAAWTDTNTMSYSAGQTFLALARNLTALGTDVTVDVDKTLNFYLAAGTDKSATVIFRHGQNIMQARRRQDAKDIANAVLGEGQGLLVESTDATSIATYGRKEAFLPGKNTGTQTQIEAANAVYLLRCKNPIQSIELSVNTADLHPFIDYTLGDTVALSIPDQLTGDYRVLAITLEEGDGPCDLYATLELNSAALEYLLKLQKAIEAAKVVPPNYAAAASLSSGDTRAMVYEGHTHVEADITDLDHDAVKLQGVAIGTAAPTQGQMLAYNGSAWTAADRHGRIGVSLDGGGSAITTGLKHWVQAPDAGQITGWELVADQSGDLVIDVWVEDYASLPATDADSITAAAPPTLDSAQTATDSTLTGWTADFSAGDWFYFNVDSASTVTKATLVLKVEYGA